MGLNEECSFLDRIRIQLKVAHGAEIARRYFAMNAFDGVLPVIGILMGGMIALAYQSPTFVYQTTLLAILGTSFAMFVSGISSSYLTETAEREREIKELEHSMLTSLRNSGLSRAARTTTIVVSLINGLSPSMAALATAVPLLFPFFTDLLIEVSFYLSISVGLVVLFSLGVFLGRISKTNVVIYGLKTVAAGVLVIFMMWIMSSIPIL
ncbi:MAG: VIT1/CCC1 transporter family protein [Candidatus Thorarchaeota archaeon]|jgi:predicted membrane protein (TIGR00267 family)